MANVEPLESGLSKPVWIAISEDERQREAKLREHFARFWSESNDDLRTTYDRFVSATPVAEGVVLEEVNTGPVKGWWVRPAAAQTTEAILYLHGGGYVLGSSRAYRGFVSQIVARTQIPALVIDYPLAPEAQLPSAPNAAFAAWDWLVAQGAERIAIVGDSAGGGLTLAVLAALTKARIHPAPVAGAVFSPWTDMTFRSVSMRSADIVDPLITHDYLRDCAVKYLGDAAPSDPMASPLLGNLAGLPPLLIQVGTDERLLDDSRQYAARAALAGVSVEFEIWEGMHHVFQLDVSHLASSRSALDRTSRFLRRAFDEATAPSLAVQG